MDRRPGSSHSRSSVFRPGGCTSAIQGWAGLVPSEAALLGGQTAVFSLCLHVVVSLRGCVLFSSYKDAVLLN